MRVKIEHTGAWMPFRACHDDAAGDRLASWVINNWRDSYGSRVTYCIALGFTGDTRRLREHYRAA